ncbi:Ig-like domain-containing protein [Anaeromyxobacter oryzae]|uniref:SbsA Ig-like domain-containing protein n=1 Tax=Anaeromyxobacter oryzae TaxID=2918170 RepID=A0ABM7WWQ8_9BACT|nr:Ig-like domain-containing protein [Anaeromyxobacter oryzae]BDG03954.1 hypothetical protein AMOR_29500 [Anaeromyxobacter oryzae]
MSLHASLRAGWALALVLIGCSGGGDPAKPFAVRIVSPALTAYTNGGEVRIAVEVDGAYEAVDLARDGAVVAELVPPEPFLWRTADVADGTYRFVARARRGTEQVLSAPVTVVVDRVKPKVVSASPSAGTLQYSPYPTIEIAFDEAIDVASVAGAVAVLAAGVDAAPAVSVSESESGTTLRIVPAFWADPVEVVVTGVRDLAGNAMNEPYAVSWPVAASIVAGPRELGAGIRFSSVRVAPAPHGGAVVAAVTGYTTHVWSVSSSGAVTALDPMYTGDGGVDVATDVAGNPTIATAGWGAVSVFRWSGSAWVALGGGPLPGTADTNNGSPRVVLDASGAPVVSWMSLVVVDVASSNYWWTASAARLSGGTWQVLPGFHPDGRQAYDGPSVALVDGVPYLACNEGPKPGSDGPSASVVLRSWDGSAWQPALETGLKGLPALSAAGGRAVLSVAVITPSYTPTTGAVRVFTREPAAAWSEVTALAHSVDSALWDGRWEVPVAVAPGPADAVVVRTDAGALRMDFRLPGGYWQVWNTPALADARQVWPAIAADGDGLYRVAHVERGADADWLEVSMLRLAE